MFSLSPRRFHSLIIAPTLLPFLFLFGSSAANNNPLNAADASYTLHAIIYGSFPFSDPLYLVKNGSVSHGTLKTFGPFIGYSQDSFIYYPDYGYVGADSFTYKACDSSGNCVEGTINLNVVDSPPNAVALLTTFREVHSSLVLPRCLMVLPIPTAIHSAWPLTPRPCTEQLGTLTSTTFSARMPSIPVTSDLIASPIVSATTWACARRQLLL